MSEFKVHTIDTAPAASVPFLRNAQQSMGYVPNLIGVLAESPADVIQAIRNDKPIADEKLKALRTFAATVIEKRGWLSNYDVAAFRSAGYSQAQVLDVVLAASLKTFSNYTNHLTETPLDDAFSSRAWQPLKQPAA